MTEHYAVSGAASGIGRALVEDLRARGHEVVGIDLHDAEIEADLSSAEGRRAAVDRLRELAPDGLDGLVPCAGLGGHIADGPLLVQVNYYGTTELCEGARPLLARRSGSVVALSSNSISMPGLPNPALVEALLADDLASANAEAAEGAGRVYASTKAAVARWVRRNCIEWIKEGIRINAIAPGMTETPMVAAGFEDEATRPAMDAFRESIPMGRSADPGEIAACIAFLLSPASRYACGSVFFVDGGHDAMFRPDHV